MTEGGLAGYPAKQDVADSPRGLIEAVEIRVLGRVQGVGYRPFVARNAQRFSLSGWVRNTTEGVLIHAQGARLDLDRFLKSLLQEPPPAALYRHFQENCLPAVDGQHGFLILESDQKAPAVGAEIAPDLATCPACRAEFWDPRDRRHGYALNACTDCGPRFTIEHQPPFDRVRTTMAAFSLCRRCLEDYESLDDRRFHAQNVACPSCGPIIWMQEAPFDLVPEVSGGRLPSGLAVLKRAAELLRDGKVLAVKGIGGFHLVCDATNEEAINSLRERKRRPKKPLAVLFADVQEASLHAELGDRDQQALRESCAPIVLAPLRSDTNLAASGIAPGLRTLGVMRAYTPLHEALVRQVGRPLIATSANSSDEPMQVENAAAISELAGIADAFLLHDRPILRHADDSVVRVIANHPVPLRVGRGLAPVRVALPRKVPPMVALGGHLKAAIAFSRGSEILLGQHIGDLNTPRLRQRFQDTLTDLSRLFQVTPRAVVCDKHPDYFTTQFALRMGLPVLSVQHHHAHILSCLAEHDAVEEPVLGISWDGTGFGDDGGIWGGEFLWVEGPRFRRVGSLWPFPLLGGDAAAREPRRSMAGACHAAGEKPDWSSFTDTEAKLLQAAYHSTRAAAICTSAGRLFDAWASLLGISQRSAYEGQAAMLLEEQADPAESGTFRVTCQEDSQGLIRVDWRPWIGETRALLKRGATTGSTAARFQNSLAAACLKVAQRVGLKKVALSGGCFQNRRLSEQTLSLLSAAGFQVLTHRRVPPGDGGLAVGQLLAAAWMEPDEVKSACDRNPQTFRWIEPAT